MHRPVVRRDQQRQTLIPKQRLLEPLPLSDLHPLVRADLSLDSGMLHLSKRVDAPCATLFAEEVAPII
jgi:ADP-heptose:LPS heptosyltransferase